METAGRMSEERRKARDYARGIEAELGPQHALGWNDCAPIDGKRMDRELAELQDLLRRLERPGELEDEERRLEDWVKLIRTMVVAGDCFHVHSLRSGLRSLIRELEDYIKHAESLEKRS